MNERLLIRVLIGTHQFEKEEQILRYKMIGFAAMVSLLIPGIGAIALFRYTQGASERAFMDISFISLIFLGWMLLRLNKAFFIPISRILLLIGLIMASIELIWFPESQSRVLWFSTIVYLGFFLLDRREGSVWLGAIISGLSCIYFFAPNLVAMNGYDFAIFILNLFLLSILIHWHEKIKEDSLQMHAQHRRELQETIAEKTYELQQLNATLHRRVDEEVNKNRDKEKQIIQQSRLAQMGEMITMIAHQWRQPLAAISATATALDLKIMRDAYDPEFFKAQMGQINGYARHLSNTIDDFRNFFSSNKEKRRFRLSECVQKALSIIGTTLKNRNIVLDMNVESDPQLFTYENELRQVILNLLKNAEDVFRENQTESPKIAIRIHAVGPKAILEIADNGGGVPAAIKERIFDPYFTTKETRDGTGLGLYMSKTIVEEHCGGTLSVYNSGEGAVFEVALRIDEGASPQ